MTRILIFTALVACLVAWPASAGAAERVSFGTAYDFSDAEERPSFIAGDDVLWKNIAWESWGGSRAEGLGTYDTLLNDEEPATIPASLVLDRRRRCLGKVVYTRLRSTYTVPGEPERTFAIGYRCPRVYFTPSEDVARYKPSKVYFGANGLIQSVRWRRWGYPVALGGGKLRFNYCEPSCAEGRVTLVAVTLRLSDLGFCDQVGELAYRKLAFTIVGRKPPGALRRQAISFRRYPCSVE